MPDGDVKIHVSADADVKAIDDAAKKVEDLAKGRSQTASEANPRPAATPPPSTSVTAASYEALEKRREDLKALRREQQELERQGDTKAAQSTGRRADRLEKNIDREGTRLLRVEDEEAKRAAKAQADAEREKAAASKQLSAEERNAAKERQSSERAVSRELKEQHAMRRAGVTRAANVFQAGADVATSGNAGTAAAGAMLRAAPMLSNPVAIAALVATGLTVGLKALFAKENDKNQLQQMRYDERAKNAQYGQAQMVGVHGSSSSLISASLDAQEEVARRKNAQPALEKRASLKWHDPASWLNATGLIKSDAQRELEDNENARIQSGIMAESNRRQAEAKFMKEQGGQRMRTLRGRAQRTLEGSREALKGELGEKWFTDYQSAKNAGAGDGIAQEMADLGYKNTLRDRQASAGAGLVDAKSGGAEIAAAARWATRSTFGTDEALAELRSMNETVQQSNQALKLVKQEKP